MSGTRFHKFIEKKTRATHYLVLKNLQFHSLWPSDLNKFRYGKLGSFQVSIYRKQNSTCSTCNKHYILATGSDL